jgi:hypothetical protein
LAICISLRARIDGGSAMKCTGSRKLAALPPCGETHQTRKLLIAAATCAFGCFAETIAYS